MVSESTQFAASTFWGLVELTTENHCPADQMYQFPQQYASEVLSNAHACDVDVVKDTA